MSNEIKLESAFLNLQPVSMQGAENCKMEELLTEQKNSAPNFAMRLFEIEPQGHTPQHSHPWEHEIFILEGQGEVRGETTIPFQQNQAILIPPDTLHQFFNSGKTPLKFLCLIPNNASYQQK